jgi:hypothetical protein
MVCLTISVYGEELRRRETGIGIGGMGLRGEGTVVQGGIVIGTGTRLLPGDRRGNAKKKGL